MLTFTFSDETTVTIPSASPVETPFDIPTPEINSSAQQEFDNHNTNANLVKDVSLKEIELTITSPDGKTFSFLEDVSLFISTEGEDEVKIAYREDIPADAESIALETTDATLDPYIKAESYSLRTEATTKELLTKDVDVRINLDFEVTADPL